MLYLLFSLWLCGPYTPAIWMVYVLFYLYILQIKLPVSNYQCQEWNSKNLLFQWWYKITYFVCICTLWCGFAFELYYDIKCTLGIIFKGILTLKILFASSCGHTTVHCSLFIHQRIVYVCAAPPLVCSPAILHLHVFTVQHQYFTVMKYIEVLFWYTSCSGCSSGIQHSLSMCKDLKKKERKRKGDIFLV